MLPMKTSNIHARLRALANDLWWTWQPGGDAFWRALDPTTWAACEHRPVALLDALDDTLILDADDLTRLEALEARRAAYDEAETWHDRASRPIDGLLAYFSAEYGIHESVRIYSGGLGILSGDHVKSASDLGLPFVAVGLLYRNGYGRQAIDAAGNQITEYRTYDFAEYPVQRVEVNGAPLVVEVPIDGRTCAIAVWALPVGRVTVYLLDTDLPENDADLREITAQLYGGGVVGRIKQEIVLGIGGVRVLRAMGHAPTIWHLNEGHSSFLTLERIREQVAEGGTVADAIAAIRPNSVFTTHTPVEAGHDRFTPDLFWQYMGWWAEAVGLSRDAVLAMGRWPDENDPNALFNMTILAMVTCEHLNGVAALHGEVSRQMFRRFWGDLPADEVPITHVTNGVHAPSWQAWPLYDLLEAKLGAGFRDRPETDPIWQGVDDLDDGALWTAHQTCKRALFDLARAREAKRRTRLDLAAWPDRLDPDALTIGFARRFAPYKRANLLFSDMPRLLKILESAAGPVQILFAGKAHPADTTGKWLVQQIHEASEHPALAGRVLLVEDYDIELGRALVQGVDVWLNNPRRPKEASGTSGMKVSMNGGLNLSILDGWWPEGFDGMNGWAIGATHGYPSVEAQDLADADALYTTLAQKVIPLYYDRDGGGVSPGWVRMMKHAIKTCTARFHSDRQVIDYVHHLYVPG